MGARPQTETTLCSWAADTASELSEPGGYLSVELPDEAVRAAMLPLDLNDLENFESLGGSGPFSIRVFVSCIRDGHPRTAKLCQGGWDDHDVEVEENLEESTLSGQCNPPVNANQAYQYTPAHRYQLVEPSQNTMHTPPSQHFTIFFNVSLPLPPVFFPCSQRNWGSPISFPNYMRSLAVGWSTEYPQLDLHISGSTRDNETFVYTLNWQFLLDTENGELR